ncbi:GTPase [Kwoniella mangroviensis CBS 10435]|uniref:GTPase n=1 Tax=Kwoniella mangroviensis CBS 10435 TaxID=1331196 RepID=A0A1B9J2R0_9TREE|nr:GTPase [Kwoniella mangroviensis CBS 10435]
MALLPALRSACPRCRRNLKQTLIKGDLHLIRRYSSSSASDYSEDFSDIAGELRRRKRKADSKRRQYGNTFVDHLLVTVRGGKGGSGACALQATLKGSGPSAPCGGNGGSGGSVYLTTSSSLSSLTTLKKRVIGGQGSSGSGAFKHGRRGEDVLITVPVGTIVREIRREGEEERTVREENDLGLNDEEKRKRKWQRWIVTHPSAGGEVSPEEYKDAEDLLRREQRWNILTPTFDEVPPIEIDIDQPLVESVLLAKGGLGGLGNPFFNSPRVSSKGFLPPTQTFEFELKLLADVGLVGFPNSGKSTILRCLTGKQTEIAGYQFTTLNPQIGVVRVYDDGGWVSNLEEGEEVEESWVKREKEELARLLGEQVFPDPQLPQKKTQREVERIRFTISDNPGLLPLASENVGLGHSFLRSIERSPVLVYVLDLGKDSPVDDLKVLKHELESYKEGLSERANVIVLNKGDTVDEDEGQEKIKEIEKYLNGQEKESEVIVLSGKYNLGVQNLVNTLVEKVELAREERHRELKEKERLKDSPNKSSSFGLKRIE